MKEPVGLSHADSKRPDRATFIPWVKGNALACDGKVVGTFTQSHIVDTSILVGATSNNAVIFKITKYTNITDTNCLAWLVIGARRLDRIKSILNEMYWLLIRT